METVIPIVLLTLLATGSQAQDQTLKNNTVTINVPDRLPQGDTRPVSHDFPSLAWEKFSFAAFGGNISHPNHFSEDLVCILQNKTGAPLYLRIGGTSGDEDHFIANQTAPYLPPLHPDPDKSLWNFRIGPSYFEAFQNFQHSKFIWMVKMAHLNDSHISEDGLEQTKLAVKNMGDRLAMLETGNEPNLYSEQGVRNRSYNVEDFVKEALQVEKDVKSNIPLNDAVKWQGLAYASNVKQQEWNTSAALKAKLNSPNNLETVSWHYYQVFGNQHATMRSTLMNHTDTTTKLSRFIPEIRTAHNASLKFILGEIGSVINSDFGRSVQGTFGATLWTVDMLLYAMSLGIDRTHMQSGRHFQVAPWNTTTVRPPYYGIAMVADFIGNDNGKSSFFAKNIDLKSETMAAYAGYQGSELVRVAAINLKEYNQGQAGGSGSQKFEVPVPDDVKSAKVSRLSGPSADAGGNVTWDGVRWEKDGNAAKEVKVQNGIETIKVVDKKITFELRDSEAATLQMIRN